MAIKEVTAKITHKKSLTHDVIEFILRPEDNIEYEPGQYVMLRVPIEDGKFAFRAYSLANLPKDREEGVIRLLVKILPGGAGSEYLKNTRVGDELQIRGGLGFFTFKSPNTTNIYFVGTGTGIAPLISIISSLLHFNTHKANYKLLWGNRFKVDIYLEDYLKELKEAHPNFDYDLILSKPVGYWEGAKGYVTELLKTGKIDFKEGHFYLCGLPQMVEDAQNFLTSNGVEEERIFGEKYVSVGKALAK